MGFFWVGFSLSYISLLWILRLEVRPNDKSVVDRRTLPTVPYAVRFLLTLIAGSGALGAAGLAGRFRGPGTDESLVLGFAAGVLLAYVLHMRKGK